MSGWNSWGDWNPGPMVTFTFDDGFLEDYSNAFPVFQAKGATGCIALVPEYLYNSANGKMLNANIDAMVAAGWEVLNHTRSHGDLTTYDDANLTRQIRDSQHYLRSMGWDNRNIAYPFGANNAAVRAKAALYHRAARQTDPGYNRRPLVVDTSVSPAAGNVCRYALWGQGGDALDTTPSSPTYTGIIDQAIQKRAWVIFINHQSTATEATRLGELIDYCRAAGVPVVTIQQALDRLGVDAGPANPETGNLLVASENFSDTAYWTVDTASVTVTPDQIAAPAGVGQADLLTPASATSSRLYQTVYLKPSGQYTWSVYLRAVAGTCSVTIRAYDDTISTALGNTVATLTTDWQRVSLTFESSGTIRLRKVISIGGANTWVTGENIYAAAAMLNEGATALPYVPGIA